MEFIFNGLDFLYVDPTMEIPACVTRFCVIAMRGIRAIYTIQFLIILFKLVKFYMLY